MIFIKSSSFYEAMCSLKALSSEELCVTCFCLPNGLVIRASQEAMPELEGGHFLSVLEIFHYCGIPIQRLVWQKDSSSLGIAIREYNKKVSLIL